MSATQAEQSQSPWYSIFYSALRTLFRFLLVCVGLVFAPVFTVLSLLTVFGSWQTVKDNPQSFINRHFYTAVALLMLELGVLHWLFPFTNFVASLVLSSLGGPAVWLIFAVALGVLLLASFVAYRLGVVDSQQGGVAQKQSEPGVFERFGLPLIGFIFAPFSTMLCLFSKAVSHVPFPQLIKNNPFIALGFVALEMGLLHWLIPSTNLILGLTLSVFLPIVWVLLGLSLVVLGYGLWRSLRTADSSASIEVDPVNNSYAIPAPKDDVARAVVSDQAQPGSGLLSSCLGGWFGK